MKPPKAPPATARKRAPRRPAVAKVLPTPEAVAAKVLASAPPGELPALWKRAELGRRLTAAERPVLDAALARLQAERQLLALTQGKTVVYLFTGPLRAWLAGGAVVVQTPAPTPGEAETLDDVYRRLVRESGGFPDVQISTLQAALGPAAEAGTLGTELLARWRRGEATLSLGDWSLAGEDARAAAVELNGEKYLLVRLEMGE